MGGRESVAKSINYGYFATFESYSVAFIMLNVEFPLSN